MRRMLAGLAVLLLLAGCGRGAISVRGPLTRGPKPGGEPSIIDALAVDPENPQTVYAVADCFIYKSTDGGGSWRKVGLIVHPTGLFEGCAFDLASARGEVLYADALDSGLFKSTNGGGSWQKIGFEGPTLYALALDPQNSQTVYVDAGSRVYKSSDGGGSWQKILEHQTVVALAIAPGGQLLYAGTTTVAGIKSAHLGVLKSTDGGASWRPAGLDGHEIVALALEPQSPTTVYAITDVDGVFKSSNGGANWKKVALNKGVYALAPDPWHRRIIYAATYAHMGTRGGVFRSADSGRSWRRVGLKGKDVGALALVARGRLLYAGTDEGAVFELRFGGSV